jgi:hypothetical protein
MPATPGSTIQSPVLSYPSIDVQTQNTQSAQQLEIALRERLQQQRNNTVQINNMFQRPRRIEPSKLPTPPSTSNSERLSPADGTENSTTGETRDGMVYKVDAQQDEQLHSRPGMRAISTKFTEISLVDRARVMRNIDLQQTVPSHAKQSRYSSSPSKSRSRSPAPSNRSTAPKGREYRNRSRSHSPVESSRRGRSYSPASRRSRSADTEGSRGRKMEFKGLQRSSSPNHSSRDSSRSFRSGSRSQGGDTRMQTRARSTSTVSYGDQLAVERVSSGRYSQSPPPPHVQQPPTPSTSSTASDQPGQETSRSKAATSLQLRISGEYANTSAVASKRARRRTCPFYHPTDKDRHPLDGPHPGYTVAEFEEAVTLYEKGCVFPPRLIKQGVAVNPKNRQIHSMRSPVKSKLTSGYQNYSSRSPLEINFHGRGGQAARSRSPNESPAKRRKLGPTTSYYASRLSNAENRVHGSDPIQPTAKFQAVATFRREPSTSYDGRGTNSYYRNTRLGGPSQQQRSAYGRQNPAPPLDYRWH